MLTCSFICQRNHPSCNMQLSKPDHSLSKRDYSVFFELYSFLHLISHSTPRIFWNLNTNTEGYLPLVSPKRMTRRQIENIWLRCTKLLSLLLHLVIFLRLLFVTVIFLCRDHLILPLPSGNVFTGSEWFLVLWTDQTFFPEQSSHRNCCSLPTESMNTKYQEESQSLLHSFLLQLCSRLEQALQIT